MAGQLAGSSLGTAIFKVRLCIRIVSIGSVWSLIRLRSFVSVDFIN